MEVARLRSVVNNETSHVVLRAIMQNPETVTALVNPTLSSSIMEDLGRVSGLQFARRS
jgi:hypothetical protein